MPLPAIAPETVAQNPVEEVPLYTFPDVARYLRIPTWAAFALGSRLDPEFVPDAYWRKGLYVSAGDDLPFPESRFPRINFRRLADYFVRGFVLHALAELGRDVGRPADHFLRPREDVWYSLDGHPPDGVLFESNGAADIDQLVAWNAQQLPKVDAAWLRKWAVIYYDRVEVASGEPVRLFPFSRDPAPDAPRLVVLDPRVRFGRPVVAGRGVPTDSLFERFQAGDSSGELAVDYGLTADEVDEAVRYEAMRPVPLLALHPGW